MPSSTALTSTFESESTCSRLLLHWSSQKPKMVNHHTKDRKRRSTAAIALRNVSAKTSAAATATTAAAPDEGPASVADGVMVPRVHDPCCVYLEQGSDFFRPGILDGRLGGWHPARIIRVDTKTSADDPPSSSSESARGVHELTVSSDFFSGKPRTYTFPSSDEIWLMEPSAEPYKSYSLRAGGGHGDDRRKDDESESVLFQAQPDTLEIGDLVFARYRAGDKWHRGRVVDVYPAPAAAPAAAAPFEQQVRDNDKVVEGAAVEADSTQLQRVRMLCSIAYDAGDDDNGKATLETHIPFQEGSDDDTVYGNDMDDDNNEFVIPRARPYVYLAQRGYRDVRWLQLELDRMYNGKELLSLRPDQEVKFDPNDDKDAASTKTATMYPLGLLPLAIQQLVVPPKSNDDGDNVSSSTANGLVFKYFRYEDVARCVFERALKRHGKSLLTIVWPAVSRTQWTASRGGGGSKKARRH